MQFLPDGLSPLAAYKQFVVYRLIPARDKTDKIPIHPRTGRKLAWGDATNWMSFQDAQSSALMWGDSHGVGFILTDADPFWFIDLDRCLTATGWSELAVSLMTVFAGAAIEISQSRHGLHIIGTGVCPSHGCRYAPEERELIGFYTRKRFIALTGDSVVGHAATDHTAALPWFIQTYVPVGGSSHASTGDIMQRWAAAQLEPPHAEWCGPTDDINLINMMLRSEGAVAALGEGRTFRDLWENNTEILQKQYGTDTSALDAALASLLAFWTGNDATRMERLMLQSQLMRDKWDRADYLPRTILYARDMCKRFLQTREPPPVDIPAAVPGLDYGTLIVGNTYLSPEHQKDHFQGCVLITHAHRVLVPGGQLLRPEQFKAKYGHREFVMDFKNEKISRDAWEAFSQSRAYQPETADTTCFRPGEKPAAIIDREGESCANIWWPTKIKRKMGSAIPFLEHLTKIVPNDRDQIILVSYMSALVQHQGTKFAWAPLIQGVEGNGKTLLLQIMKKAIGTKYSHLPNAQELSEKFNDWLAKKIFIGVDEIYVPTERREILEILKPWITGEDLEIRAMNTDKHMQEICCNFMFLSNHKEGLRKTANDRRFAPFYTPQQSKEDLAKFGMQRGSGYFRKLFNWFNREDGYAITTEFLYTYKIPDEFNPASKDPAPDTSSTTEALAHGLGRIEQEILEAIEQDTLGFRGGWISSLFLDYLLKDIRAERQVPPNKRRELLQALGYSWHPGLPEGRVNNKIEFEPGAGKKPRLFIRNGHASATLLGVGEITRAYTDAQQKI